MMIATRLNPTTNGKAHLGHAFTLLVNEHFSKSRQGKFFVRFDDENAIVRSMTKEHVQLIIESQIEDILWLGMQVDNFVYQSEQAEEVQNLLTHYKYEPIPEVPLGQHKLPPAIRMGTTWIPFPYVVQQTVERVIMDHMLGITHVIRGDDFLTEYSLYCYFCQKFELPTPEFIFLPRLASSKGDISKTNGGFKIADYRDEGHTPEQLKTKMREACLIYPNNGWELYNIKSNPMI